MSKKEKLLRKVRTNPKGITFNELDTLLNYFEFDLIKIRGSHYQYERIIQGVRVKQIVSRHSSKIKPYIVKQVLAHIDRVIESEG